MWLEQLQLFKQAKAAVKFQAKAEREGEVSSEFRTAKDEIDLSQLGMIQRPGGRAGSCRFIEMHMLLGIEFAHEFEQGGQILI